MFYFEDTYKHIFIRNIENPFTNPTLNDLVFNPHIYYKFFWTTCNKTTKPEIKEKDQRISPSTSVTKLREQEKIINIKIFKE